MRYPLSEKARPDGSHPPDRADAVRRGKRYPLRLSPVRQGCRRAARLQPALHRDEDRKSTRLNSSHQIISYAVFCLKKKKTGNTDQISSIGLKRPKELATRCH